MRRKRQAHNQKSQEEREGERYNGGERDLKLKSKKE